MDFGDDDGALPKWVKRQRYQYKLKMNGKHNTMTDERAQALEAIGFAWSSQDEVWEMRYEELCEYAKDHGHCNVPSEWAENTHLAVWVKCQRRQYRIRQGENNSGISDYRIAKLKTIGFKWNAPKPSER